MVEVVFVAVVTMFEDSDTTLVYVLVQRFAFDYGVSFVFCVSFY